jgi:predicted nucleic acid-binding protein
MAKVVLDANVIISAAFGGKPLEAVVQALENHEVYLSLTNESCKKLSQHFPRNLQKNKFSLSAKNSNNC